MESKIELYLGDCLEIMPILVADNIDVVITDIPYEMTGFSWDEVIPFKLMWKQVTRIVNIFITTASQPFTSKLIMSNLDWFRYEWIWYKNTPSGFAYAKYQPLRYHENVLIFGNNSSIYNPQPTIRESKQSRERLKYKLKSNSSQSRHTPMQDIIKIHNPDIKGPESVLKINTEPNSKGKYHPTQKPVALYEYLIRTYTNEGDTVLDIAMGVGTTGIACIQTKRNFIGIEIKSKYFKIAEKRIKEAQLQIKFDL